MLTLSFKRTRTTFLTAAALALLTGSAQEVLAQNVGDVILSGNQWLQGTGVDIHYNGADTTAVWGYSYVNGVYVGLEWQCVELPQRLYTTKGWYIGYFNSDAYQIYDNAGTLGMYAYPNGSGYVPVPGDMVVWAANSNGSGPGGHVAVVDHVDGGNVYVCEQNANINGRAVCTRSGSNGSFLTRSDGWGTIRGCVHSPNDPYRNYVLLDDSYSGQDGNGEMQIYLPGADNILETDWQNGPNAGWVGWSSFNGPQTTNPPAVGYNADGRMQVFVRGSDNNIWTTWKTSLNGGWSAWNNYGGPVQGNVTVGYVENGAMQIFARSPNNTVVSMFQTAPNGGWSALGDMGGSCYADPVVGPNQDGRMQVFIQTSGHTVQSNWKTTTDPGASWSGWSDMGGSCYGKPAVGQLEDGRMYLFIRTANNTVQGDWQTSPNGGWQWATGNWGDMGGSCYADPVLGYNADGRIQLFTRSATNSIWSNWKTTTNPNASWNGWTDYGGTCSGVLAVGYNADDRLELFMRDNNNNVQSKWQTSPNGGWNTWQNMWGWYVPTITTQPSSQTVSPGANVTFTVAASHALTYQWQKAGANISGATSSSYTINNVQTSDAGNYTVVVGNNAGTVTSSTATLTVTSATPPTITTQPASQTVSQGANATFSVVASGSAPLSYQWTFNGGNISGATGSSYTVSNAQASNQGNYNVVVTNPAGSTTSATATLTVKITVIVDNNTSGFTASANWSTGTSSTDKYGADYRYRSTAATGDAATWTANLANAGSYTIYAWWPQGANRSTNAPYIITWGTNITTVKVNQQINGNTWNSLGTYNLNAGNNTVQLSCWTTTGFVVIADAIKWVQQ